LFYLYLKLHCSKTRQLSTVYRSSFYLYLKLHCSKTTIYPMHKPLCFTSI